MRIACTGRRAYSEVYKVQDKYMIVQSEPPTTNSISEPLFPATQDAADTAYQYRCTRMYRGILHTSR